MSADTTARTERKSYSVEYKESGTVIVRDADGDRLAVLLPEVVTDIREIVARNDPKVIT